MADELKVVLVGAASPQWGYKITRDILVVLSSDSGCSKRKPVLVLEDIDEENLEKTRLIGQRIADKLDNRVRVQATPHQREAIQGADFVVTSLAAGTLEAMLWDIQIPHEYGIFQPVGDSISIGGAIRAARNIPVLLSIAEDMKSYGKKGAWLLNLCNPMSMLTRAVIRETGVQAVGLCHELYGGLKLLSQWLDFPFEDWKRRCEVAICGINHCGWLQSLKIDGKDAFEQLRRFLQEKGVTQDSKRLYDSDVPELRADNLKIHFFLKYGMFPFSGDRHTSEFFQQFLHRNTNLGADYGIMLTTVQERLVHWRGRAREAIKEILQGKRDLDMTVSHEAVARIIRAITVDEPLYDTCNLPYTGDHLPGVPQGAVIERMCVYDRQGTHPVEVSPLPDPLQDHLALHAGIIEDVISASVSGDRKTMLHALDRDPLLGNMDRDKIPEMWDRLAEKHKAYLHPGFQKKGPLLREG